MGTNEVDSTLMHPITKAETTFRFTLEDRRIVGDYCVIAWHASATPEGMETIELSRKEERRGHSFMSLHINVLAHELVRDALRFHHD